MKNSLDEDIFFKRNVRMKKKFSKKELALLNYFFIKTKIFPKNVILIKNFIFFFIPKENYFEVNKHQSSIRKELKKKILFIRDENIFINLLFGFFPNLYIHDLKLNVDEATGLKEVKVCFVSYEERGIAIGRGGDYIKAINQIFKNHVKFEKRIRPIKVTCEFSQLDVNN